MSSSSPLFETPHSQPPSPREFSPGKLFTFLALMIFIAEMIVMVVLYFIQVPNYVVNTILDGLLMILLIFPGLYYLQLRPLWKKIKEHEQAEKALRTSEAYLTKIMESLPVGVWIVDQNGGILHANPVGKEIWEGIHYVGKDEYGDYSANWASTGKPVKPEEWAASRAIAQGEAIIEDELIITTFKGTKKVILNSAVPLYDEDNVIQGAVVVNQDITQRRELEKDSIRANRLLERYFNSIHSMIAYLDRDFNFVRVNQAYAASAGHPVEFFTGKNHFALYPHPENQAIFSQVVETGQPYIVFEKPFENPEYPERGVTYWDWSLQPVMGPDNQVEGVVFSLVDVTRRKLAEIQLERQNQALRELTDSEHRRRVLAEGLVQSIIKLNTSLDLDQVLSSVLEQTRKEIPFEGANILLREGVSWRAAAFLGFKNNHCTRLEQNNLFQLDEFPFLQQVFSTRQIMTMTPANGLPDCCAGCSEPWCQNPGMAWVRSFAAVPLVTENEVTGIVELYSQKDAAFDQDKADRLNALAAPAALVIHNALLYQAESKARQVTETMRAAAQGLSQTLDVDHVIRTLLDYIHQVVNCDTSGLTLMEGEERWTLRALRGYNAWANQKDIPKAPLDEITRFPGSSISHEVTFVKNPAANSEPRGNGEPAPVLRWAILPILIEDKVIGFVELGKTGKEPFTAEQIQWAEALVSEGSVAIQNAWLFEQVRSSSIRLQSLARKLVDVQEKEREHISRELHDEAGQVLSSMKLSLGRLEQDPECTPHLRQHLSEIKLSVDGVLENLHRLAMDLRPVALDHLGLVPALEQLAAQMNAGEVSVKFKTRGIEGERLPQDVEISLYRIVQEALTNVRRHAHAKNVGILLERNEEGLKLFVEDDGVGFIPETTPESEHLGLVGMRERSEMLGGNLTIESSASAGTSIIVEVPHADSNSHHR